MRNKILNRFETIAQDLTIVKRTEVKDDYDRIIDFQEETKSIKGFIDYGNKNQMMSERGGTDTLGDANLFIKHDNSLNKGDIVIDEASNKWVTIGFTIPIHDQNKESLFNRYSLNLIEEDES